MCQRKLRWPRNRTFLVSILPGFRIFELQNTAAQLRLIFLGELTIYTQIDINPANIDNCWYFPRFSCNGQRNFQMRV